MAIRKAHARWEGSLKEGKGKVDSGNRIKRAYSFASRFEEGVGVGRLARAGLGITHAFGVIGGEGHARTNW